MLGKKTRETEGPYAHGLDTTTRKKIRHGWGSYKKIVGLEGSGGKKPGVRNLRNWRAGLSTIDAAVDQGWEDEDIEQLY